MAHHARLVCNLHFTLIHSAHNSTARTTPPPLKQACEIMHGLLRLVLYSHNALCSRHSQHTYAPYCVKRPCGSCTICTAPMSLWLPCGLHGFAVTNTVTATVFNSHTRPASIRRAWPERSGQQRARYSTTVMLDWSTPHKLCCC